MLAIAFTGGPGFGKSTMLSALDEARGYKCVPESARAIIQERVSSGLIKSPPAPEFAEEILARDQAQYRRIQETQGPVFFDRSVIDALGMRDELGPSSTVRLALMLREFRFHRTAFVFPHGGTSTRWMPNATKRFRKRLPSTRRLGSGIDDAALTSPTSRA